MREGFSPKTPLVGRSEDFLTPPPGRRYNSNIGQVERSIAQSENSARTEKEKSFASYSERQKNGSFKVISWEFYEAEMSLTPAQRMKELVNAHKILINASKRFAPLVLKAKAEGQS
jgi:hypothetical protein